MRARRLLIAVAALVAALIATAGTAFAYWATTGSGSGSATTGTMTFTVTAQTNASALVPGGTAGVTATVANPNGYALPVTSITAGAISASCTSPAVTFTAPSTLPTLAAGSNTYTLGTANMGTSASSDCQGKTITIAITVTVQK